MSSEKVASTAKRAGRRLATGCLYVLAIIGGSSWDRDPDSWSQIFLHLVTAAWLASLAVRRTVSHWHEDQEDA